MQQCALLVVLALALALTAAQASRVLEDGSSASRQLQQTLNTANSRCPDGCRRPGFNFAGTATSREADPNDYCQEDSTSGGLFCTQCYGTLMVKLSNGRCSCPRGKYSVGNSSTATDNYQCIDCPKNSYCAGGDFVQGVFESGKQACPNGMWTIGARTETKRGCVNKPGYSYSIDASGDPSQTICPVNTYGPGYKKQRSCVPCPTGFTTNGEIGRIRPTACIVPAGYYLKAPGQAAPCPMGEWKSGIGASGNCTKCAFGVTTVTEGSIAEANCTKLLPGRYATAMDGNIITATQICPQKYYCPGGFPSTTLFNTSDPGALNATEESTIIVCPEGTWTQELGSTDVEQCLTPPGYQTFNQNTTKCAAGYYRADWKPRNQATNCLWCGSGVGAEQTDRLKVYNIADPTDYYYEPITTSSDDCFIEPGQGLYYSTITGQWRARNCDDDNYGVTNRTYGLTPSPCRDCPAGMITNVNSSAYYYNDTANFASAYGYIDPLACVTEAGYGYNGRIAQPCDKGSWNPEGTRSTCTPCDYGYTTRAVGGTEVDISIDPSRVVGDSESDCGVASGFGYYNFSGTATLVPCPRGTFNNDTWDSNTTAECTSCTTLGGAGLFTLSTGSDSTADCNVCAGGYGGDNCNTVCGGNTTASPGSYGLPDQPVGTPCTNCSYSGTGYSFEVNATNLVYAPLAVARPYANSSKDCVAAWLQVVDKAWYMDIPVTSASTATVFSNLTYAASFQDCLDLCDNDLCQFVTYDYDDSTCQTVVTNGVGTYQGDDYIAWKVGPAGDTGTSSLSDDKVSTNAQVNEQGEVIKPKAVPSGFYSWYKDDNARVYGTQTFAANYTSTQPETTQACLNICDEQPECAGVSFDPTVGSIETSRQCKLVFGIKDLGVFKRTFLRAAVSRFTRPADGIMKD